MKRVVALVGLSSLYAYASACCGVSRPGQPVKFGDQRNIVVWNPETKTEHFVRDAGFDSTAKDFGFIAATPVTPELKESNASAYDYLGGFKPHSIGCAGAKADEASAVAAVATKVEVLQQVDVGKYSATTVRSDDPAAMAAYLKKNGYASNADTDEWIGFYTRKKWVFTAFKVRSGVGGNSATGVIRMSFRTDEPFNPYYVPGSNSGGHGTLKVYFVSDSTYSATVGQSQGWIPASWNNQIPEDSIGQLSTDIGIPVSEFPKRTTVTYFEKYAWLEGAKDDLYFHRDSALGKVAFGGVVLLGAGMWWFTRSRRAKLTTVA